MDLRSTVVKTLGWLIVLSTVHLSIVLLWQRDDAVTASQWGDNRIRTERFLYEWDQTDCILVGSSMSANLPALMKNPSADMPDIRVMAYAAGSAIDGLGVIVSSGKAPRCVLVEANLSYKEQDDEFINDFFHPVWNPLKRFVASFRYENYPLNLFLTFIKSITTDKPEDDTTLKQAGSGELDNGIIQAAPARLVQDRIEGLAWADDTVLGKGVEAQLEMLDILNERGTKVLFFVMPGEPEVRASNYYQILDDVFEQAGFPSESDAADEHSLYVIDAGPVGTNDGIHLNAKSLRKIPEQLFKLVNGSLPSHKN